MGLPTGKIDSNDMFWGACDFHSGKPVLNHKLVVLRLLARTYCTFFCIYWRGRPAFRNRKGAETCSRAIATRQAGDSSVGRASDCRHLQQSDGPWFDSGSPDFFLVLLPAGVELFGLAGLISTSFEEPKNQLKYNISPSGRGRILLSPMWECGDVVSGTSVSPVGHVDGLPWPSR